MHPFLGISQNSAVKLHSHNDYEQDFPLVTAIQYGASSIEVDVFLFEGEVVVAHDEEDLDLNNRLADLYLDPLLHFEFEKGEAFILLIDLKMVGVALLDSLHSELDKRSTLFKKVHVSTENAPFKVVLSGSVDKQYLLAQDHYSYFHVDGRISDLDLGIDSEIMPIISADFEDVYCYKPGKRIKKSKLDKLLSVINRAHAQGKEIRFWNTKDDEKLWDLLIGLHVDFIGVDHIQQFSRYKEKFK